MRATATTLLDRPVQEVWAFVSDVETMAAWVEGVSDVEPPADGLNVGARFSSSYSYRGKTFDVDYEVTAVDPPTRLDIRSTEGPFPFEGTLRLTPVDGRTRVSNTIDAGSDGLATTLIFTLLGPIMRRVMRRQLATELDALADALEEEHDAATSTATLRR